MYVDMAVYKLLREKKKKKKKRIYMELDQFKVQNKINGMIPWFVEGHAFRGLLLKYIQISMIL